MNEFMKTLLSLSVSGTLLLLLILGLKQLYKEKFYRRWQYYVWIIVALRFLLPFTPNTSIVGELFEKVGTTTITDEIPESSNAHVSINEDNGGIEPIQTKRDITAASAMRKPFNVYVCLFFVWSALSLVLFVRKITIYQGFIQYIKVGNTEVSDIKILNLLSECEEKLNIKTRVELSCNPLIDSPILVGFFHPRIVLPAHRLEDKELSYIFVHELIHYKQKDMFYKWLIQIVVCIHWFNPFVYLLEKEVNRFCELSCDEKVISVLDDKARREYGDTLIAFFKTNNSYKNSLASVTLTEGAEQLKERLGAIMNFKKKTKLIVTVSFMTAVLLSIGGFAIGAYAAQPIMGENRADSFKHTVIQENGVFYILCNGADESDKPSGGTTDGSIKFVLVRKESYTSISGFNSLETLVEDVKSQCDFMQERGTITEEEKDLVIETAAAITSMPQNNDMGADKGMYSVLTYKTTIDEAPEDIQSWIKECESAASDVFVKEYDGHYWIYTNVNGTDNDYSFKLSSESAGTCVIEIIPIESESGNGYVLLSAPAKYNYLSVKSGEYTTVISK